MSDPLTQMADALRVTVPKNYDVTPIMVAITPTPSGLCYTVIISVKTDTYEIAVEGSGPDLERSCWIAWREFGRKLARALQPKPAQPTREVEHWPDDPFTLDNLAEDLSTGGTGDLHTKFNARRHRDGSPSYTGPTQEHTNLLLSDILDVLDLNQEPPAA